MLDFSTAQRNGFIEAFVDFMCARIPGWNTLSEQSRSTEAANLRTRDLALIKGCIVHWKRSLHKIKQVIGEFEMLLSIYGSGDYAAASLNRRHTTAPSPPKRPQLRRSLKISPSLRKRSSSTHYWLVSSTSNALSKRSGTAAHMHPVWLVVLGRG